MTSFYFVSDFNDKPSSIAYQQKKHSEECFLLVHLARIELARPCGQQILSLQRLPVPPQVHEIFFNTVYTYLLQ